MANTNELRAWMVKRGVTQADCAKVIGVDPRTMSTRMKTGIFGSDEIEKLVDYLKIDNPIPVFFPDWVNPQFTA